MTRPEYPEKQSGLTNEGVLTVAADKSKSTLASLHPAEANRRIVRRASQIPVQRAIIGEPSFVGGWTTIA